MEPSRATAAGQPTISVIASTFEGTRAALRTAVPLARGTNARLVILVPRIVPYPAEIDTPVEPTAFFARSYQEMVASLGGSAQIDVCLCRRIDDLVGNLVAIAPAAVVIGGPAGRWLTSPEERFSNRLSASGVRVVFVACGTNTTQRRVAPGSAAVGACTTISG